MTDSSVALESVSAVVTRTMPSLRRPVTVEVALAVVSVPGPMQTTSAAPGTPDGVQLPGVFQVPVAGPDHVFVHADCTAPAGAANASAANAVAMTSRRITGTPPDRTRSTSRSP